MFVLPKLSPGEWGVLGIVAEGPTHGFAISQLLAHEGELGRIHTVQRPKVYQALTKLLRLELVEQAGQEPGARGPSRTVITITPLGQDAVALWLRTPVDRVRDMKSMFMLKLALLDRSGVDPARLLRDQRLVLEEQAEVRTERVAETTGFDRTLAQWRLTSTQACLHFIELARSS